MQVLSFIIQGLTTPHAFLIWFINFIHSKGILVHTPINKMLAIWKLLYTVILI